MSTFLTDAELPYCKGCGHHLVVHNTVKALAAAGLSPLDVVLVTDIGCHGIADSNFTTHTVHGLHGRSVALAAGIAMGTTSDKKIIVYLGDGGATIGLQHILEAARLNVDLTAVVHNNMLYGMTGGQPSGLTPEGFRTVITPQGNVLSHHDLCRLVRDAGAAYVARVIGLGDFSDVLGRALATDGFALVEVLEICVRYGAKMNPGLRLRELANAAGYEPGEWSCTARPSFRPFSSPRSAPQEATLLDLQPIEICCASSLAGRLNLVIGGSAGEGVQQAAELLAHASIAAGLYVTKKGSYPVTVGTGFSTAEVVLSNSPILYHGVSVPDVVIITSADGLQHNLEWICRMDKGTLWLDESLPVPETGAEVRVRNFRARAGARNAALCGVLTFVQESGVIPLEALVKAAGSSPAGTRLAELM